MACNGHHHQRSIVLDERGATAAVRQNAAYSNGTASEAESAEILERIRMLCAMQMAVRPANIRRRACALAAVTVAVTNACAASCKALVKFTPPRI